MASSLGCGDRVPQGKERELGLLNATIPSQMVSYLDFAWRDFTSTVRPQHVVVAAPAGWASAVPDDRYAAWLRSPAGRRLDGRDVFAVGVDCAGACEPKAWPEVLDAVLRREVPDDGLLGDEALPDGGRIRWGRQGKIATAYAVWARPTDSSYRRCFARLLDPDLVDAITVFAAACKTARWLDPGAATPRSGT
ncbi:MAG: hypothetical protein R2939_09865 [Kofleriaceae bacterium]